MKNLAFDRYSPLDLSYELSKILQSEGLYDVARKARNLSSDIAIALESKKRQSSYIMSKWLKKGQANWLLDSLKKEEGAIAESVVNFLKEYPSEKMLEHGEEITATYERLKSGAIRKGDIIVYIDPARHVDLFGKIFKVSFETDKASGTFYVRVELKAIDHTGKVRPEEFELYSKELQGKKQLYKLDEAWLTGQILKS